MPPSISARELDILHDPMPLMPLLTFACPTESLETAQALVYTLAYWNFRVYSINVFLGDMLKKSTGLQEVMC